MRPRPRVAPAFLPIIAILSAGGTAHAFPSHSGGTGLFDVQSAHVPVHGSVSFGISGLAYRVLDQHEIGPHGDRDVVDGGVRFSWSVWDRIEAYGHWNQAYLAVDDAWAISYRDGSAGAKIALPWTAPWIETAVAGSLNLPWGVRQRGFSTGNFDPAVLGLVSFHLPESNTITSASVHLNVGYHFHGDSRGRAFEGHPPYYLEPVYPEGDNDRIDLRLAVDFGSERLTLFTELLLDQLYQSDGIKFQESPLFLTPGFRYSLSESFSFTLASKIALATDQEETTEFPPPEHLYPDWQLGFALSWSRFGPSLDRDGDGVPDVRDRCPRDAEDQDGWEDQDGCPDADNDGDGIRDTFDDAPNEAEDYDGFQDSDGVPEPDNDLDGFLDGDDQCPESAEDLDGVADGDGCPETDADSDGVVDPFDACPELAALHGGLNGCPEGARFEAPFEMMGVEWKGREISPEPTSFVVLEGLADRLKRAPLLGVEIRLQPAAAGEAGDADLAAQRAEYLKGFLVKAGVASEKVVAGTEVRTPDAGSSGMRVLIVPFEVGKAR